MRPLLMMAVVSCLFAPLASAHPGRTDACGGHQVTEVFHYASCVPSATGNASVECADSEAGEYHFHFTAKQMNGEVLPSLSEYRRTHPASTSLGIDHGSFTTGGKAYDIWEYTRQGEAILHCRGDENVIHTGIARVK